MDGSVRDSSLNRRRVSLASVAYAVENYPPYVLQLASGRLRVEAPLDPSGSWFVRMIKTDGMSLTVLREDFDRIKSVAVKFAPNPRVFPSEPENEVLNRIAANIRVLFSDRSP